MTHPTDLAVRPDRDHRAVDLLIAVTFAAGLCVQVAVATEPNSKPADWLAFVLAAGIGVSLLWRRTRPLEVLFASLALVMLYHALLYPAIGAGWPLALALGNAAYYGRAGVAVATIGTMLVGANVWRVIFDPEPVLPVLSSSVQEMSLAVAVILAGSTLRSRRMLAEETRERMRLAVAEQQRTSEQELVNERIRVARELHDVVAHTVALIGIHARVGGEAIDDDLPAARRALEVIDQATKQATAELGATIDLLRDERSAPRSPIPTLEDLPSLIETIVAGGLPVEFRIEGDPVALPGSVELAAYRIIQEALTNVVRHAHASCVRVTIAFHPGMLTLEVSDNGSGSVTPINGPQINRLQVSGHGITGMRERVEAAGGRFSITDGSAGGMRVWAELPVPQ